MELELERPPPEAGTRIFISYRRIDTAMHAAHLHASLARRFGTARVFRDVATIAPGAEYAEVIERAVAAASVVLVLIGRRWLSIKGADGRRRLDDPDDLVRLEVQSGLKLDRTVIPILLDGAEMPSSAELPAAIAELAERNAQSFGWHEDVARLGRTIARVEREREAAEAKERAERERLDVRRGTPMAPGGRGAPTTTDALRVVTDAMELSISNQGGRAALSASDLRTALNEAAGHDIDQLGFTPADLVHVIDFVGVKARRGGARYVARSYPLAGIDDMRGQFALHRPVLAGLQVYDSWWSPPGPVGRVIELAEDEYSIGSTVVAFVAWDPGDDVLTFQTAFAGWGDGGSARMSRAAAERSVDVAMLRSIEAVPMLRR